MFTEPTNFGLGRINGNNRLTPTKPYGKENIMSESPAKILGPARQKLVFDENEDDNDQEESQRTSRILFKREENLIK